MHMKAVPAALIGGRDCFVSAGPVRSDRLAVLVGRAARDLLEQACEVLRVLEPETVGHVADRTVAVGDPLLGRVDQAQLDVLLRRAARFALDQIAEVVGREVQPLGAVLHGGKPRIERLFRSEVVVQNLLETGEDVLVGNLAARDELPVVEARAVVEQHLDVVDDERAAVSVGGLLQLVADVAQALDDRLPLLLREVQRLAHLVGEEGVAADVAPELRAAQQVGMEEQGPPLGLELHAPVVDADALPR